MLKTHTVNHVIDRWSLEVKQTSGKIEQQILFGFCALNKLKFRKIYDLVFAGSSCSSQRLGVYYTQRAPCDILHI